MIDAISPLRFMDYDVSRYLYETYFPTVKTKENYDAVMNELVSKIVFFKIVNCYSLDINDEELIIETYRDYNYSKFIHYLQWSVHS